MTRSNNIILLVIIIIFAFILWALIPLDSERLGRKGLNLGLDLVGGVHLVYQAQFTDNITDAEKSASMERTLITIQNRIDRYGVTEPIIQQMGDDRIIVQLPGFTDIEAAKNLVEQTGFLEFREVERDAMGRLVTLDDYLQQGSYRFIDTGETGDRLFVNLGEDDFGRLIAVLSRDETGINMTDAEGNPADNTTLQNYSSVYAWVPARGDGGTALTGSLLSDAQPNLNPQTSRPEVDIEWNDEGAEIFDQIAVRLHNPAGSGGAYSFEYVLGIFLDQKLLSAPQLLVANYGGKGTISGSFTLREAETLATLLKSGSLPMPLQKPPLYQEKVSATLGAEFIDMSWKAGLIALLLVMAFMIAYYRLPGLMASFALIFYGALVLTIFKLWPAPHLTITLAGLGGLIASLGMAVDANILIFERLKEELRTGRTLGAAVEAGFQRAWSAIWDSNVTTIIACIILVIVGSNITSGTPVKWFGITLLLGVIISMLTAMGVTRILLRLVVSSPLAKKTWLFNITGGKKS